LFYHCSHYIFIHYYVYKIEGKLGKIMDNNTKDRLWLPVQSETGINYLLIYYIYKCFKFLFFFFFFFLILKFFFF